jgi:hypothetical protein
MSRELYTRDDTARNYSPITMETGDEISFLLLQIENLMFTKPGEVLGSPRMGIDLESLLYTININEGQIKSKIINQIHTYCPLSFRYKVNVGVNFLREFDRDIGIVDISINDTRMLSVLV